MAHNGFNKATYKFITKLLFLIEILNVFKSNLIVVFNFTSIKLYKLIIMNELAMKWFVLETNYNYLLQY
jgi:hypothetical protein